MTVIARRTVLTLQAWGEPFHEAARQFIKETRGHVVAGLPMQHARLGKRQVQPRARPRDRHIHQASLFFQTLVLVQTVLVREQPLFQSCDEHGMEFQPLG